MHVFDRNLSLKDNSVKADDIEFAAWTFADQEHREEFRNAGNSPERSAWLREERMRALKYALSEGNLLALGIAMDDHSATICRIPENLFLSADLRIDAASSTISSLGREFGHVRICRAISGEQTQPISPKSTGRPNHLPVIMAAWAALKDEISGFLDLDKSVQNLQIQKMSSNLFPSKFPGKSQIGESTIRRHRRDHPDLFN